MTHDAAAAIAFQADAIATGRAACAAGKPVIFIHGRPYADPGFNPDDNENYARALIEAENAYLWELWYASDDNAPNTQETDA